MYTSSIAVDTVIDAMSAFLALFMPSPGQIVRGQVNRTPQPLLPCIVLTEMLEVDLSVPSMGYQPLANTATIKNSTRIDIQIDFYSDDASDICKVVQNSMRSIWGYDQFPDTVKPLYTSNGIQAPMISGEQQYQSRWTLTASMQYNPVVTVPQQFADELAPVVAPPVDFLS